jgi:hypothetical protein
MQHAFVWIPSPYRWVLLAMLLIGTVVVAIKLTAQGKLLRTSAAPQGILSYQFAWSRDRVEHIISSWHSRTDTARQQLRLDFGFLVIYPLLLSLACAMLAESSYNSMAAVGVFLSWAMLAAGPLDAVENWALLRMLKLGASEPLAQ